MNEEKIKEILEENAKLKEELEATKEHLKKYNIESIHELVEKIKKMETQLAKLKCELQTYGVVYTD